MDKKIIYGILKNSWKDNVCVEQAVVKKETEKKFFLESSLFYRSTVDKDSIDKICTDCSYSGTKNYTFITFDKSKIKQAKIEVLKAYINYETENIEEHTAKRTKYEKLLADVESETENTENK